MMKSVVPIIKPTSELGRAEKRKTLFKRKSRYSSYIYKMLKQVHPRNGSSKELIQMKLSSSLFDQIAVEAARLSLYNKRRTITSQEVQNAAALCLQRAH
ncbi:histone H2B-like [Chiloscyllium plagiosum]|uniref:histone H2B-like n=1 Tax=Chiloscyllium plagiosum TaxID=36176 RepID=UPI001CB86875|nr:histone H2B-like [Chiloscyllium plagiosum]